MTILYLTSCAVYYFIFSRYDCSRSQPCPVNFRNDHARFGVSKSIAFFFLILFYNPTVGFDLIVTPRVAVLVDVVNRINFARESSKSLHIQLSYNRPSFVCIYFYRFRRKKNKNDKMVYEWFALNYYFVIQSKTTLRLI